MRLMRAAQQVALPLTNTPLTVTLEQLIELLDELPVLVLLMTLTPPGPTDTLLEAALALVDASTVLTFALTGSVV
jgi:hypothetical protein